MTNNSSTIDPILEVVYLTNEQLKTLLTKHDTRSKKIVFELAVTSGEFILVAYSGRRKGRAFNQNNAIQLTPTGTKGKVDLSVGNIILSNLETNDRNTLKLLKGLIGQKNADYIIFTP